MENSGGTSGPDSASIRSAQDRMDEIDVLIALKDFEGAASNIEKGFKPLSLMLSDF